jgi:hypothetical protein
MQTQEIAIDRWPEFMDQFSRLHRGKNATVSIVERLAEPRSEADNVPLLGITDEHHGQADEVIEVMLGAPSAGPTGHAIRRPSRIRVSQWNDAYSARLEVDSADGERTIIQVGPAREVLPPGIVLDGVPVME